MDCHQRRKFLKLWQQQQPNEPCAIVIRYGKIFGGERYYVREQIHISQIVASLSAAASYACCRLTCQQPMLTNTFSFHSSVDVSFFFFFFAQLSPLFQLISILFVHLYRVANVKQFVPSENNTYLFISSVRELHSHKHTQRQNSRLLKLGQYKR